MNLFVYSDESGVFDKIHNDLFVFGGVIFLSSVDRDNWAHKYTHAEKIIKASMSVGKSFEAKATHISNTNKAKLYRSLNKCYKFGAIINQEKVHSQIFADKKSKQRYLDYAYKIAIKRAFQEMMRQDIIAPQKIEKIHFFVDEHTTATNGRYELCEALEEELKIGTLNYNYSIFYPPIFPNVKKVELAFCNSATTTLVRAADIVANRIFFLSKSGQKLICGCNNLYPTYLP